MGCKHEDGGKHDCRYVDRRNALIPIAEARANLAVGADYGGADYVGTLYRDWSLAWDREFHRAMTDLSVEL